MVSSEGLQNAGSQGGIEFFIELQECLSWFKGVLLSGQVKVLKPDRRIFEIFLDIFRIEPSRAIYIDDTSENVEMAVQLGMRGVVFRDSAGLRTELTRTGLLVDKIQGRLL